MQNKKVLFFDIDETLFSHRILGIPESAKQALKEAKKKGHLIFINTGRTKSLIGDDIKELEFDGYICGCGTYIEVNDEVLYHSQIDKEISDKVMNYLKKYNIQAILEGKDAVYIDKNAEFDLLLDDLKKKNYPIKFYDEEDISFNKMFIRHSDNKYIDNFCDDMKDVFDYIEHGLAGRELVPKGHSKASGIDFLIEHLNINKENTFAFGDSNNDLSMLENVPTSIVMGNGNPDLFDKVTFVTKHIDEDGIQYAMKYFKIID